MTRIMTPVKTVIHEACAHSIITQDDWDALVAAFTQARNEALEQAVYAAWGALPVGSDRIKEMAVAIRALKSK